MGAQKPFRPWVAQRRRGLALVATGGLVLSAGVFAPTEWMLLIAVGGGGVAALGLASLKRARARAHGQEVEAKHLPLAVARLEDAGFETERNVKIGRADVDLVVRNLGQIAAIEVKSFGYWRSRLRDRVRERNARRQVLHQKEHLGARAAVLWLPNARHTWVSRLVDYFFPEREVTVIRGPAKHLVSALLLLMRR